ncbi:MAG: aspartate/glutamate racemase family protein [Bacillota bacterium]
MKTIGLIGGMSWESSLEYYKIMNQTIKEKLGGTNSAKILLYSFNFYELEALFKTNNLRVLSEKIIDAAINLEKAGADCILFCSNTTHIVASEVEEAIKIKFIHIVDAIKKVVEENKIKKVALLGTKYTIESKLYEKYFNKNKIIKPNKTQINYINEVIYNELILGKIKKTSKNKILKIINELKTKGAEAVILGCTELPLLIKQRDIDITLLNSTKIHADAAVKFAIK